MVDSTEKMSIRQQCTLLGLCRSSLYYTPATENEENLKIMELLDKQYDATPFYGQRRLQAWLATKSHYRPSESSVGIGYKLHTDETWLYVSFCHHLRVFSLRYHLIRARNYGWD